MNTSNPASTFAGLERLTAVDHWRWNRLRPYDRKVLENQPIEAWPVYLLSMGPIIGDDLAPTPEGRLLLVRMAVELKSQNSITALILDTSPMVRRAALRGANEIEGIRPKLAHHDAMAESIRWEKRRKQGKEKIPRALFAPCWPPLLVDGKSVMGNGNETGEAL